MTKQHWKRLLFSGVYLNADSKQKVGKPGFAGFSKYLVD